MGPVPLEQQPRPEGKGTATIPADVSGLAVLCLIAHSDRTWLGRGFPELSRGPGQSRCRQGWVSRTIMSEPPAWPGLLLQP